MYAVAGFSVLKRGNLCANHLCRLFKSTAGGLLGPPCAVLQASVENNCSICLPHPRVFNLDILMCTSNPVCAGYSLVRRQQYLLVTLARGKATPSSSLCGSEGAP